MRSFEQRVGDLVLKEADSIVRLWIKHPFVTTDGVGKLGLAIRDADFGRDDIPFKRVFEDLTDRDELLAWADFLERFSQSLRKRATKEKP